MLILLFVYIIFFIFEILDKHLFRGHIASISCLFIHLFESLLPLLVLLDNLLLHTLYLIVSGLFLLRILLLELLSPLIQVSLVDNKLVRLTDYQIVRGQIVASLRAFLTRKFIVSEGLKHIVDF